MPLRRESLRDLVNTGRTFIAPGATDALSARLVESAGFPLVYIGSYATAASRFGLADADRRRELLRTGQLDRKLAR